MSIHYVVSSRYTSVVVFGLLCLSLLLSFVLSLPCPSLQSRVTLLRQMAFCLAELHLWSTKSSLQVKGSTYHHVQSPTLSLSRSFSIILSLALSVITHFVFTPCPHFTYIYSQSTPILTMSVVTFSSCSSDTHAIDVCSLHHTWRSSFYFYNINLYLHSVPLKKPVKHQFVF